jgi:protein-tyrosine phosphatase
MTAPENAGARPLRILFVCMGNICRSPLAEGIFLHQARELGLSHRFEVDSCGIGDWHIGHEADVRSQAVALKNGITLACRSRQVTREDFDDYDWILAMDHQNERDLRGLAHDPETQHAKIRLMRDFDPTAEKGAQVPDPYYGGPDGFDNVYAMLDRACRGFLETLQRTPARENGLLP